MVFQTGLAIVKYQEILMNTRCARLFIILLPVVLLGCEKFVKQESENLAPFAQQTIDLIGTLEYSLSDLHVLYLRSITEYIDEEDPYARYLAMENQVGNMLAAVVTYSLQIVAISEQNISENKKANKLADVVVALVDMIEKDQVIPNENIDAGMVEDAVAQVRQSEEYLEALRLMLPLINEFSAHAGRVLDELRNEKQRLAITIEEAIDRKYGSAMAMQKELRLFKDDMYQTLINLSQYSVTRDPVYFEKMKSYGMFPVVFATKNKKSLNAQEMYKLHKDLTDNLRVANENYEQLLPDVTAYHEHHRELAALLRFKEDAIREARQTFVVWSRAYQKMAGGKTDPAEWFDISESGQLLFGLAKKAAGI